MENKKTNTYSYSAAENSEIMRIREKYEFRGERNLKIEQLRKLDRSVRKAASAISISIGVIGIFLLGFGLSCVLVWKESMFAEGIAVGVIGIVTIISALPVYNIVEKKKRKKVAPEIIKLTDELLK